MFEEHDSAVLFSVCGGSELYFAFFARLEILVLQGGNLMEILVLKPE